MRRERGGKRIRKWWQKDKKAIEVREEGNVGEKGGRTKEKGRGRTRHRSGSLAPITTTILFVILYSELREVCKL